MPRYPQAGWIAPRWWAPPPEPTAISRRALIGQWVRRAAAPKPRRREFTAEMAGWSGLLGREYAWVRAGYGVLAAFLAHTGTVVDEPLGWEAVSRLYADHVDGLARFSAQFALIAHGYQPRGLPNLLGDIVKCYEWQVPPAVRAVMAGPARADGTGGVVDTQHTSQTFLTAPDERQPLYLRAALRHYATVLLAKRADFAGDSEALESFDAALESLRSYGDPASPRRTATPDERRHVDSLLAAQVRADVELLNDSLLEEAYRRARATMLRWVVEGRELTDATVLYTKLRSARLDAGAADCRRDGAEILSGTAEYAEVVGDDSAAIERVVDAQTLGRASAVLLAYPMPAPDGGGDCWEKVFACDVLSHDARIIDWFADLHAMVITAWNEQRTPGPRTRPPGAVCGNPAAAANLVTALLFQAVSSVVQSGELPGILGDRAGFHRVAARQHAVEDLLIAHGLLDPDGQVRR